MSHVSGIYYNKIHY